MKIIALPPLVLLFSSCSLREPACIPKAGNMGCSRPLSSQVVLVDPRKPLQNTRISVHKGKEYLFAAVTILDAEGRGYADASETFQPATPDGSHGFFARLFDSVVRDRATARAPEHRLRVLQDADGAKAHFMSLMGVVGRPSETRLRQQAFIIGSRRVWRADKTGMLHVFVNDWPETVRVPGGTPYSNNRGALVLSVTELDDAAPFHSAP